MRIIGGVAARRLVHIKGFTGRPTTERVREALFNILDNQIVYPNITFLDLFSGMGMMGLEAASRGAQSVLCVDKDPRLLAQIKQNAQSLELFNLQTLCHPVEKLLLAKHHTPFNVIFADPPYDSPLLPSLPQRILQTSLLAPEGLLIVEHPAYTEFAPSATPTQVRRYGRTHLSFFQAS